MLGEEGAGVVVKFFNRCVQAGRVPGSVNCALMRLLPKTDQGLSDLTAVRPIALMENLVKVYEQIIIGRVLSAAMQHNVLDLSQYGGLYEI